MHYFIDGYNLMYRMLRAGDDLKSQRESIISQLTQQFQALNLDASIVFDAQYQFGEGSRAHLLSLEICFTDSGETADDYIIKRIKASPHPQQETVVTSDKKLSWRARRHLSQTQTVEQFLTFLNKRYQNFLRQKQKGSEEKSTPRLPKLSVVSREHAKQAAPTPAPGDSAEASYDYYLFHFEKMFRETASATPKKTEKPPQKKKKSRKQTKPPKSEEPAVSELERWLRLFEQPRDEDDKF